MLLLAMEKITDLDSGIAEIIAGLKFHHIGVATESFEREIKAFSLLGYKVEGEPFEEPTQGMRGQFLVAPKQPRLELIENLPGSTMIDVFLKNKIKMYQIAYTVKDVVATTDALVQQRCRIISPPTKSVTFGKMVSFLLLPNRMMIELIEE